MRNDPLTEKIIGAAIEVHRHLGPGLLESIYEEALCIELDLRGVPHERQVQVDVLYKDRIIRGQRIDLVVAGEVIVEIKAVARLPDFVSAQVLSYLKSTALKKALLLNFSAERMAEGIKRYSSSDTYHPELI